MKKNTEKTELMAVDKSVVELFQEEELRNNSQKKSLSYIPSFFTTASLPFKNIHKPLFIRKGSNGVTLILQSPITVPFGKYGRLLLTVLCSHAVLSAEKDVPVTISYNTLADLLKELQLPKQRGTEVREQLQYFSNAQFMFEQKVKSSQAGYLFKDLYADGDYPKEDVQVTTYRTANIRFTNGVQFEEIEDGSGENKYGHFKIYLSAEFASFCQAHAVPIDYTAYKEINSPVGKDLYAWLVYRNNGIKADDPPFIPRQKLVEQFMPVAENSASHAKIESNNYNKIISLIREIKEKYYPELRVGIDPQGAGITLYKSPTPVLQNDTRYALITAEI